jgi:di/tricarboxylate transporter
MTEAVLTLTVLAGVVILFVTNRIPVEVTAIGSALVLYALGILTLPEAFAGFADPAVVLIASLFVVSEGLDATGVTTWLGGAVVARAGSKPTRLLLLLMLLAAAMTGLIGLNGTIAALLPMAIVVAMRRSILPSRLLMPMVFAGAAGQMLLLTGSPVNVVISDAAAQNAGGPFGFAEFALVGIPVVAGTVLIALTLSSRLVPERVSDVLPPDLSNYATTLVKHYRLSDLAHLVIGEDSDLVGSPRPTQLDDPDIRLLSVLEGGTKQVLKGGLLSVGDIFTVIGNQTIVDPYAHDHGLEVDRVGGPHDLEASLLSRTNGAVEIVIPPRSELVGTDVSTSQEVGGGIVVLALTRQDQDLGGGPVDLQVGDTLLVEGPWQALDEAARRNDILVVDSPDLVRRQAVPLSQRSTRAIIVLLVMIVFLALGLLPPAVTALLAAGAMILLRVVTVEQSYRGISWTTVFLVAGMFPMSTAITNSGAGELIATGIVNSLGALGPTALLAGLYGITVVFSQLISNTATALVMIPIGVSAASQLDVSARPVLMSLCVAATVSFLTPVATPPNMMIMGPGGYQFGDFWKMGLPLVAFFGIVAVFLVPVFWSF